MTNKEWIKATVAHRETGRVPYSFMFSPPAMKRLCAHYGVADLNAVLNLPARTYGPASPKPLYASPDVFGPTVTDEFGVVWSTNYIDRGAPLEYPLTEADLSSYTFPDPHAPGRFDGLAAWCAKNTEHYTGMWVGALWERATFMRSMEELLYDLAENRPFVEDLLEALTDNILQTMETLFTLGDFDGCFLSDDYGTQKSLLMSPADWRALIKPRLERMVDLAKKHGRQFFLHSCGNVEQIIPDFIELGLDILHPIQPEAMDIYHLKREYGRDITFCGGIRTQDLLPLGTPAEVRAEVRKLKETMGAGGGYILEPGITVQDDVPLENMVAMIEEAMN